MKTPYHFVIQTTIGRKNLDDIKDVPEILRYALDDKKKVDVYYDTPTFFFPYFKTKAKPPPGARWIFILSPFLACTASER